MARTSKKRTILLNDVIDSEITNHQGSFTWTFNDYKKNVSVRIKLERWWINHLAENLWDVINDEEKELDKLRGSMKDC